MAINQKQVLSLQQKLSPQQIQMIKLLELPAVQLEQRIKQEIEDNIVLEEEERSAEDEEQPPQQISFDEYLREDDTPSYKSRINNFSKDDKQRPVYLTEGRSLQEYLVEQLGYRNLPERDMRLAVYLKGKNAKKYRHGIEYGSARWGTAADIAPYMDKDFFQNIPMTQTERITMASRPKQPKYARNKNILVIGGSGSGKTRFFCKPSLLQAHSSYVCTDPKGTLLPEIGAFLERKKYRIKCLNLINFRKSMKYNPLAYIRSEKDILKLVNALIMNTKGEGEKSSEDFWVKAERLYYSALIGYIWYEATEEEKNFITLLDLINASEAREDDETYQSPVDLLFSQLEEREPDHFAVKQYRKFKMAAGKTLKSILISCGARLAPFDIKELRNLMEYDELELDTLGDQKTALFVILSDTDSTFNFVAALMYSQLFNLLCDKADDFYGGRLPVHVRLILDEFANIGQIPNFDKLIATIRSREISASIILQSQSQLKTIYKDAADTIVGNCDSTLFLGGKEKSTLKEISELLGKETIDLYNQSENRGSQVSHGLSYQKLGKDMPYLFVKSSVALNLS